MESIVQLLSELREHDIKLELNNGNLDVISYGEKISQDLIVKIKTYKEEIKAYLASLENVKKEAAFIPEVPTAEMYAIAPAQRRLWLLSQFEGGSEAYNMPVSIQLNGEYHIENFKKAILATIDRHEILRTVFIKDKNDEVQQKIETKETIGFEIKYIDYRNEKNPEFLANAFVKTDTNKAFNLSKGPLVRVCLLQTSDEKFVFYYNLHHSISDGWSMDILARDVMAHYEAYQSGNDVNLPELRIQYKDYASWQIAQQTSEAYQTHKNYWLDKFTGELPLLEISSNTKRPKLKTYNGATLQTYISPSLTSKLEQFIVEEQGSLFTTLLAIWNVLLSKHTSQNDIIIGSPVTGRNHSDLKDQIGFYVNMMALRNEINSEESFKNFYKRVKDDTLEAFNHQDYPFDQLVEDLQIIRNPDRNPVFDVVLVVKNEDKNNKEAVLDHEKIVALEAQTSKYDLQLSFQKSNDALVFELNYNTDVYDRDLIENLVVHFKELLSTILLDSSQLVGGLSYLSSDEKETLLEEFSGVKNINTTYENVVVLFQEQAFQTPTAIAVSDDTHNYTYQELDLLSNQFANYLIETHRIDTNNFVGLSLPRDARYIISLLGILKSGCGFVPIDAKYPSERQSYMLENSGANILITESDHIIEGFSGSVISYDTIALASYTQEAPSNGVTIESSAYIMYTSGSTGVPKGVEVSHQNIVRLVKNTNYYQFSKDSVVLSTGSFSFDATTFEFFGPLLNGGKLVLSSYDTLLDVGLLKETIQKSGVTVMWFTSGWLNELVSTDISLFKNLQTVIAGGDKLSGFHIKQLRQAYPLLQIINGYGPTENTTFSLTYEIGNEVEDIIPIGYPINGSSAYILDNNQHPVGIGIVGELYLGGLGLAKGYVGDQELTNEKFIESPFNSTERLYKTGDLGMWSTDGKVHFMGRSDSQLKIRGHRIELGELSHIAQSHENISNAHAAVIESTTGEKSLVLYYISEEEDIEPILRSYLQERLPSYMLPSYYHVMERFPLTANGKLDYAGFPEISVAAHATLGHGYVAARNEKEAAIIKIWETVLSRAQVGVKDDYFLLGGNSISAIKLLNEYHKQFGVRISVQDLFEHSILEDHVALLANTIATDYQPIPKVAESESYPLSNSQLRLWYASQLESNSVAYNMFSSVALDSSYDIGAFEKAIHYTVDRHESLRTVFKEDDQGGIGQVILSREALNFIVDHKDYTDEADPKAAADTYIGSLNYKVFDLSNGPLLRVSLLKIAADSYIFYSAMHHIISDGWSMELLSSDIFRYYKSFSEGKAPKEEPLRIQYKDYAVWQQAELAGNTEFDTAKDYWLDRLSGELPLIDLPNQKLRPKFKSSNGHYLHTYIDAGLMDKMNNYVSDTDGSLFMLVLSLLNTTLYRYTGNRDTIIGSPVAGRNHPDLENQIGFYVNNLAMRTRLDPEQSFNDLYQSVKQHVLSDFAHQQYPFDTLVEELGLQYDASRTPLYDISLTLHNISDMSDYKMLNITDADGVSDLGKGLCKNDVEFHVQPIGGMLSIGVMYNTDLYDQEMISSLLLHFKELTKNLINAPETAIGYADYLKQEEKEELLHDFKGDTKQYTGKGFLELFKEQVAKTPEATALVYKDKALSYEELDTISTQLAHCLVADHHVALGDYIGIQLSRDERFVWSILGILKSGAAYVSIDPGYPEDRKAYMVGDAGIKLLITDTTYMFDMDYYEGSLLALDVEFEPATYANTPLALEIPNTSTAYVIYTSGSTGLPKGVRVSHANLSNLIHWQSEYLGRVTQSHVLQYFSYNFDGAVGETFWTLSFGHKLCMYDLKGHEELSISEYILANKIQVFVTIPSLLKTLSPEDFSGIDNVLIVVVGEVFDKELYQKWKDVGTLVNGYGPTENTVYSTVYELGKDLEHSRVPIGKAITNTGVYLLDDQGELVGKGITGELYVNGANVAQGYLNREKLTRERFVADIYEIPYKGHLTHNREEVAAFIEKEIEVSGNRSFFQDGIETFYNDQELSEDLREKIKQLYESESDTFKTGFLRYLNESKKGSYSSFGFTKEVVKELLAGDKLQGKSVLDIGFGNGELLDILSAMGANVYGIDANPYFVHNQSHKDYGVVMSRVDLSPEDFKASTGFTKDQFDITFMTLVLDRLEYPKRVLESMFDTLKSDGRFCVQALLPIIPFDDGDHEDRIVYTEEEYYITEGQSVEQDKYQLLTLLQQLGGGDLAVRSMDYYVKSTDGNQKYTLWSFTGVNNNQGKFMYKTGDIGRWLADGNIDFLGRKDSQVKIRGHRIELDEIIAALDKLAVVKQSTVIVHNDNGNKELIAYVVPNGDLDERKVQKTLKDQLPDYMVPRIFIILEEMPLNHTGKINTKALPAPDGNTYNQNNYIEPVTEVEKKLASLWESVLGIKKVGLQHDFFDLGGNSINAVKLIAQYNKVFQKRIAIKDIFDHPKLQDHATLLAQSGDELYSEIKTVAEKENYPLSNAQLRLWLTSQIKDALVVYNMPNKVFLEGNYSEEYFKKAIDITIARHESLRTLFKVNEEGEVRQYIVSPEELNFELYYQDFSEVEDAMTQIDNYISQDSYKPFNLEKGPLLRAALLKQSDGSFIFYSNMHHIISDGWSMEILSKDIMRYYNAIKEGTFTEDKPLNIQYKDYAAWQQSQLYSAKYEEHKAFWLAELAGELPVVDLPSFRERPKIKTYEGHSQRIFLSEKITKQLREFVNTQGGSLFTGLLTATNILLYRYSGQNDIIVGNPVAGRDHADLQDQIGFYINTLAFRNQINPTATFEECHSNIKESTLEALKHQMYPLDRLLEELNGQRDVSRNPLFDIQLNYHGALGGDASTFEPFQVEDYGTGKVKFDVVLNFTEIGDKMEIVISYNTEIYDHELMKNWLRHFYLLLEKSLADTNTVIGSVDFMLEEEKQLLTNNSQTEITKTTDTKSNTILEIFKENVNNNPDAEAIVFADKTITYKGLDEQSSQLANCLLKEYGIKKGDCVGVFLDREINYIVSILGILKAGAVYVPIDVNHPSLRKNYIATDADLQLLITNTNYMFDIDFFEGTVLAIDVEFDAETYETTVAVNIELNDTAYIAYVSGANGNPIGTIVTHEALYNYTTWATEYYANGTLQNDDFGWFNSSSISASITSIFFPLLKGGSVHIFSQEMDLKNILKKYFEKGISSIKLTTAQINLLQEIEVEKTELEQVIVTGETLKEAHKETLRKLNPEITIFEEYESVEASIGNINKPIPQTEIYILDANKQIVPKSVTGEVYIGGKGLAKGYLNLPELTAAKFVEHPFKEGERIYKTGDLARWTLDGSIELLGRNDNQTTIRGHKVELGEIEAVLKEVETVQETAVIAKIVKGETKELIAYIVSETSLNEKEISNAIGLKLPEYMLPDTYITLGSIPRTNAGKVDYKALPSGTDISEEQQDIFPPKTIEEKMLLEVMEAVLKRESKSIRDNFYNLGGDSIKSIQVVSRLRQKGYVLSVADILATPILEEMAVLMEEKTTATSQKEIEGEVLLTPIQHYLFENDNIKVPEHYNQSVILTSKKSINETHLENSLKALVKHHDALRMVYTKDDSGWKQHNNKYTEDNFLLVTHNLTDNEKAVEKMGAICEELQASFNLGEGPLFIAGIFKMKDGDRLAIICHHLIIDGVSWRILLEDLASLYQQHEEEKTVSLPDKTDSFQQWAKQLQEYVGKKELRKPQQYWEKVVQENIPNLPTETQENIEAQRKDQSVSFEIGSELTEKMQTQIHDVYHTEVNDVLLTSLGLAIKEVLGVDKTVIMMEGHGREDIISDIDINRTLGWFTSLYPFVLQVAPSGENIQSLINVKDKLRMIPNKGIDYGIIKYLGEGFDQELTPTIKFNYLGDFGNNVGNDTEETIFEYGAEYIGKTLSDQNTEDTIISISGIIVGGKLSLNITYDARLFSEQTMEKLKAAYQKQLSILVEALAENDETYTTSSDLTFQEIAFDEIQKLNDINLGNIEDIYELSPSQKGMYYHWLVSEDPMLYFGQLSYRIKAEGITKADVKQAYDTLIERYSILRTGFINHEASGRLLQVVRKNIPSTFSYAQLPANVVADTWIQQHKLEDRQKGFKLDEASQMRLLLLELGNDEFEFIWSHHHILMDGWCSSILINDFYKILQANSTQTPHNLPDVRPYADYIKWLNTIEEEDTLLFWKNYLANYSEVAEAPYRYHDSIEDVYEFGIETIKITDEMYHKLATVCNNLGVTQNTFMEVAWGYLLSKYNNTQDVVFGSVVSGRPADLEGIENMVGLFINTIPVRIKYEDNDTLSAVLKKAQSNAIESLPHHYLSLSTVQGQSELGMSLLDHVMVFENFPIQELLDEELVGEKEENKTSLSLESIDVREQMNYDFSVIVTSINDTLKVDFEYNKIRYSPELLKKLIAHLQNVIETFIAEPTQQLQNVEYLNEAEKDELLNVFNAPAVETPKDKTLIDLFRNHVEKTPNAIALAYGDEQLTFVELEEKSNQLANYLVKQGITTGTQVPMCIERSTHLIISILAVMKTGAVYVPIEASYPKQRIEYILKDVDASIVLTQEKFESTFQKLVEIPQLIFADSETIANESGSALNTQIDLQQNVYIIYTSGTTGMPKGVIINHESLLDRTHTWKDLYGIDETTKLLQMANFTFDLFSADFCRSLMLGATLVVSENDSYDPITIYDLLQKHQVTFYEFTPGIIFPLMNYVYENQLELPYLKTLIVGSDTVSVNEFKELVDRYSDKLTLFNCYGTTETSIDASVFSPYPEFNYRGLNATPIGKPIQNTTMYVLDKHMRLVPVGVAGELYIGGIGVGVGYLNRPELSEEKFVKHPFIENERVYKTGDLARVLLDGNIEFIGRKDDQVKIRGYRIELGEIESALNEEEIVQQSVVVARDNANGYKQLIAYVVGTSEEINKKMLQEALQDKLPDYMIPAIYVFMDEFPLSENSKVNKKALPLPDESLNPAQQYVAPENDIETTLAVMWQELFKIERIGTQDNFFELGGDSLAVINLIMKIQTAFGVKIKITDFFARPTVKELGNIIYIAVELSNTKNREEKKNTITI